MARLAWVLVCGVLLTVPATAGAGAGASDSASAELQAQHAALVELVAGDANDAALTKRLDALVDSHWLAETSLGGPDNFAKVCAPRCDEFEALLRALVHDHVLRLVRSGSRHPLEIVGEVEGKGGLVKVTTQLTIQKHGRTQRLRVEYVVCRVDGHWRIRDILTDGVSLAKTYRHEFHELARSEGIDGIIARLRRQLDES